jgi:hypothetical protein
MSEYQVMKRRSPVTLFLTDGLVLDGTVFLSEFAAGHEGPETLVDLLLDAAPFFPLVENSGRIHLVGKQSVAHARGAVEHHPPVTHQLAWRVVLTFSGGDTLQGELHATMPPGQQRLQDYLNQVPPFFPLITEQFQHVLNRQQVRGIQIQD